MQNFRPGKYVEQCDVSFPTTSRTPLIPLLGAASGALGVGLGTCAIIAWAASML
jgi:hypothetical protein